MATVQNNSVLSITGTTDELDYRWSFIKQNYPENPSLMWCAYKEESTYGTDLDEPGDSGMAYGHWQVWLSKHPSLSYQCAMNFECSTLWTISKWRAGKADLWTGYRTCINK